MHSKKTIKINSLKLSYWPTKGSYSDNNYIQLFTCRLPNPAYQSVCTWCIKIKESPGEREIIMHKADCIKDIDNIWRKP